MKPKSKIAALIVAGGGGTRIGGKIPKQYVKIEGASILLRSIFAYSKHPKIDLIQVVIRKEDEDLYKQEISDLKILPYVFGGETRQESVLNGLKFLENHKPDYVLIHDAARPFVTAKIISSVIKKLSKERAVVPVIPVTDTIKEVAQGTITKTLDREFLVQTQTPQGFEFNAIVAAHKKFKDSNFTDDASIAEAAEIKVKTIAGDENNFKITTKSDLIKAEQVLNNTKNSKNTQVACQTLVRTGLGFDVHAFEARRSKANKIILCGVKIPYSKKLKGHSDADVGLHAIADALLGAAGLGDIGEHFPPSDNKWKNADSSIFIKHIKRLLHKNSIAINNLDITIVCEEPKILPYKEKMRVKVANLLNIEKQRVNIKATTTEKLGFTGRKEGVAAQAIASVIVMTG